MTRAPVGQIAAPSFPRQARWVNVAMLRMDQQVGRPVLIEFWDFCRVNSLRTLPYLKAWHERYEAAGLRVIGIHTGAWEFSRDPAAVRAAVARLGIEHPVVLDTELQLWDHYGNKGWPARYLWDQSGALWSYHYGEGAYAETEREMFDVQSQLLAQWTRATGRAPIRAPLPGTAGEARSAATDVGGQA